MVGKKVIVQRCIKADSRMLKMQRKNRTTYDVPATRQIKLDEIRKVIKTYGFCLVDVVIDKKGWFVLQISEFCGGQWIQPCVY